MLNTRFVNKGNCRSVVEKSKREFGAVGFRAWQALSNWYNSKETKGQLITSYQTKCEALVLDESTTVKQYVDSWETYCLKLEELGEPYSESSKKQRFLKGVVDETYLNLKEMIMSENEGSLSFDDVIQKFKRLEEKRTSAAPEEKTMKNRRLKNERSSFGDSTKTKKNKILRIPNCLLKKVHPLIRLDFLDWKDCYNQGKRWNEQEARSKSLHRYRENKNKRKPGGKSDSEEEGEDQEVSKPVKKKTRATKIAVVDAPLAPVKFSLFSENGLDGEPVKTRAVKNSNSSDQRIIFDTGTAGPVVGGKAWKVLRYLQRYSDVSGGVKGMDKVLPMVDAVSAVDYNGQTFLIGAGSATLDPHPEQNESLLNSHTMRDCGIRIDDRLQKHGGSQNITISDVQIPLEYDKAESALFLKVRCPTEEEIKYDKIVWLNPVDSKRKIRRKKSEVELWSQRFSEVVPQKTIAKTLQNTTQLIPFRPMLQDVLRPRRHMQKRDFPLVPQRINGRVDSDTFFSNIKSIRNFTCAQLFVVVSANYIMLKCLQREAQSHSALLDFLRKVGAPSLLITDNSKTQTGKRWRETCQWFVIDQGTTEAEHQNQNHSERSIQDIKRMACLMLQTSLAPLVFWCYALELCTLIWNVTSKNNLEDRTPHEVLTGNTADLSVFRFAFWQPVWVYLSSNKFPRSKRIPGRFIGMAQDSGDSFCYKIWLLPHGDEKWKEGKEIIRSSVYPRYNLNEAAASGSENKIDNKIDDWDLRRDVKVASTGIMRAGSKRPWDTAGRSAASGQAHKLVRFENPLTVDERVGEEKEESNSACTKGAVSVCLCDSDY